MLLLRNSVARSERGELIGWYDWVQDQACDSLRSRRNQSKLPYLLLSCMQFLPSMVGDRSDMVEGATPR